MKTCNYLLKFYISLVFCYRSEFDGVHLYSFVVLFQYPLKEVVVIHQDPEALKDIQSLQKYILEVSKLCGSVSWQDMFFFLYKVFP